ncbi:MAG: acetoacetate--CoA ligase, partial [Actinomycetes bacterium]
EPDAFWSLLLEEVLPGVERIGPTMLRGDDLAAVRWFPEVRLNVAERILTGAPSSRGDDTLVVGVDERGRREVLTRSQAIARVAAIGAALRADGVGPGDRVAAWMPNIIETFLVMLGAASVGAVFSSTSPDFGSDGVLDRFAQITPTVLVAADGYSYGGTGYDRTPQLAEVAAALGSLRRVVVVPFLSDAPDLGEVRAASGAPVTVWSDWVAPHGDAAPAFEQLPFDHPWYILFSSGTTGVPKCIVHRTGGVLLQHAKEQQLHLDLRPGDRAMYFTTCGWMMWNWLVSAPASGASIVLYEGNPAHPTVSRLWELAAAERLHFLGVGAKYVDSVRLSGFAPSSVDLSSLRTLASTGSPLSPESFEWVMDEVAPACSPGGLHLASISGGTDLCGCFVGGDPTLAVWAGELQGPALGMAVDVWTEDGEPAGVGERGELVCTEPFPSMPLRFWGDGADTTDLSAPVIGPKYRSAYFERFPPEGGTWAHGDFASWTDHGGMVIHGRSDTTLNPGGVRIGTAEIYRQVEQVTGVAESLVFGQEFADDTRIVLLVRCTEPGGLTDELVSEIRSRIRSGCTPRHVPALVLEVDDLPRTRSGKLAELAVADAVNGREVRNTTALANPEVLDVIAAQPGLVA